MKILLINPPIPSTWYNDEYYLPSSLLYLGAVLQNNGEQVKIIDMEAIKAESQTASYTYHETKMIQEISDFKPDLIGFGCLFSGNFPDVLKLSICCKKQYPDTPIVAGGIHFTIYASQILTNCPSIDWICLGESEVTIIQLVDTLKNKNYRLDSVEGFAYRKDGKVTINPAHTFIKNIDTIPFPAYNLINLKDYYVDTSKWHNPRNMPIHTSIPLISSRSCPNQCTFCSVYMVMGPKWRGRSAMNVVDEIEFLYKEYDHKHFSFMDDNLTFSKPRALEICRLIRERKLDFQFETPSGLSLNTLDEEVLNELVSVGLVRISLAIESGSDFIRNKVMKKRLSREKIFEIINLLQKHPDVYTNAFFIMGMPEETHETLNDTRDMIKEINVDKIHLMNIVPFPSTHVYDQALRDNLLVNIDTENIYKADDLYFKNYDHFFIKPYNLSLDDLHKFRASCDELISNQNAHRQERQKYYKT